MTDATDLPPSDESSFAPTDWVRWAVLVLSVVSAAGLGLAWTTQKKVQTLEQELVRRQQNSQNQAAEARLLSRQAQDISREASARTALLESHLAEITAQRSQVDELVKTLAASRDDNLVTDIEANLRVALQQALLTGSAEPLVTALQAADARLARARQPRLDSVRRGIAKDLDRLRATRVADLSTLTIRLDEGTRLVDELVLLSQPVDSAGRAVARPGLVAASAPGRQGRRAHEAEPVLNASSSAESPTVSTRFLDWSRGTAHTVWREAQALVRITRIRQPDAILIAPEQALFLRENLKLRLLNARLALMSRQSAAAVADLNTAQQILSKYFDPQSRKTQLLTALLSEVATQSPHLSIPRPDDTLSALTAAGAR